MNRRSAPHANPRLPARAIAAAIAACVALLVCAVPALAAPTVTIGSFPPLNSQSGTFSFDADGPALRLECKLDASPFSQCVSPLPLAGLAVSTHTFSVRAIGLDDSVGVPQVYTWTIDLTRPDVPVLLAPPDNLLTSDSTPTFSGTAEPLAHVPVFDGSTQIGNPQAGVDGQWSFTPLDPLIDGTHLWRVRAIDSAGNRSDYTVLRSMRIDTQAPAAPVLAAPTEAAKLTTRTPLFSGTGEPQSTIAVSEGATRLCSTAVNPSGGWNCLSTVQLVDGAHAVNVIARDGAGNEGTATERSFDVDATPPDSPLMLAPVDGLATTEASLTVAGLSSPGATIVILNGATEVAQITAGGDGIWSHTLEDLDEGEYEFTAKEVDDFGNRSAPSNVANVRVDRTPPTVTLESSPPIRTNQLDAHFEISADEPDVDFECELDVGGWQPCDPAVEYAGLAATTHEFKARGTDRAGNVGEASDVFAWTIDLDPPAAPEIDSPTPGATVTNPRPTFTGDAEPGADVELFAGTDSLGTVPANAITGAWALTPGSALPQGELEISARAVDAAGNVGPNSAVQPLTVDSVAPATTIQGAPTQPLNANTVTVTFSADDPLATFSCSLDSAGFVPCSSPHTTAALSEATHNLRVRARDLVGNLEAPAAAVNFTVDRTAPVGQSALIAGSAGSDGIPKFQIASNDPGASARCKIDNGAFADCSGQYKPATTSGIHALTIRYTDAAGNFDDQVFAFSVTPVTVLPEPPTTPPQDTYDQPPLAKSCKVLGREGLLSGRMRIVAVSGTGRILKLTLSSDSAALLQIDAVAGSTALGSIPTAVRSGRSKLTVKLKRAPAAGAKIALAVRFYSVRREFGTARLSLVAGSSGLKPAVGAQSTLDTACPTIRGSAPGARLTVPGATVGARSFVLNSNGKRPGLIAIKAYRSGITVPVVDAVFAVGAGRQKVRVKLLSGARLARGGYKFTFDALGAGGRPSSGRGAFVAR
ncbi:MAG: Ig-like domain-containing protein [Solirubrobacterales bacterium]